MQKFVANSSQNVSFLNIFHFHLHPILNSSALHFSMPEENELLFCVFFYLNFEAIKNTSILLLNKCFSDDIFQQIQEKGKGQESQGSSRNDQVENKRQLAVKGHASQIKKFPEFNLSLLSYNLSPLSA